MSFLVRLAEEYRIFSNLSFVKAVVISLAFLVAGAALNMYANVYATVKASNHVEDIILSNIPALNFGGLFIWGTIIITIFVIGVALVLPRYIPFAAFSLGVFYFIRTVFVSLTHLGPFPDRPVLDVGTFMEKVLGGADMFFSGHTGAPFLLAFVFWHQPLLRYVFLAWSVFFAVVVLLGHFHYSIDVLSAYFITFTIFHFCERYLREYRGFIFSK